MRKRRTIDREATLAIIDNVIDLWSGQIGSGALHAIKNKVSELPTTVVSVGDCNDCAIKHCDKVKWGESVIHDCPDWSPINPVDIYTQFGLTPNRYQELTMRTCSGVGRATKDNLILQGVMGMSGESGEALDLVKKHLFQGHELDKDHLARELGDVLWYVSTCAVGLGMTLEEVMSMNISKLSARYPEHFDPSLSIHRKEGDL